MTQPNQPERAESVADVLLEMRSYAKGLPDFMGDQAHYPDEDEPLTILCDRIERAILRDVAAKTVLDQCDRILVNMNDYFVGGADAAWLENDRVNEIGIAVKLVAEFGHDGIYALVAARAGYKGHWRREDSAEYKAALVKARAMLKAEAGNG